jgi:signal transduction histidine kinase
VSQQASYRVSAVRRAAIGGLSVRTWIEAGIALLVVFSFVFFFLALLGPQVAYASDRVALMSLREYWVDSASGFGLRNEPHPRSAFLEQYRLFRSRSSVQRLLKSDREFSSLMISADKAFERLEAFEIRGTASAALAAAEFDVALGEMAARVGDYARHQLEDFRLYYIAMMAGIVAAIAGYVALELRLRDLSAGEERNRAFSRALIAAQEGERLRISRELHDAVAQDLAAAKLYCGLCGTADAARAAGLLDRAIEEIRGICYGLRPAELDRLGIAKAGARLSADVGKESGIDVQFSSEGLEQLAIEPETEINLYRILQEALANVRRHSMAGRARVALVGTGDAVELSVEDDGLGTRGAGPGLGRTGMEERARMIGGSLRFGAGPWGGSILKVRVPARLKGEK